MKLFNEAELANLSDEDVETYEESLRIKNEPPSRAEIVNLIAEQEDAYQQSLKHYRDYHNTIESAEKNGFEKGFKEGFEEARRKAFEESKLEGKLQVNLKVIKIGLEKNLSVTFLSEITGFTEQEIIRIKDEIR